MKLLLAGVRMMAVCGLMWSLTGCATVYPLLVADIEIEWPMPETTVIWSPGRDPRLETGKNIVVHAPVSETGAIYSVKGSDVTLGSQLAVEAQGATKRSSGDLIAREPSVWVSEIERQFMSREFRVLSRQQYHALLREQGVGGDVKAASILGADYIVQINALEYRPLATLGPRATVTINHYEGNQYAEIQRPCPADSYTLDWQRWRTAAVMKRIEREYAPVSCAVCFDAKVVDVPTGEVLCSYRERRELVHGNEGQVRFLFRPSGLHESDIIGIASRIGSTSKADGATRYEIGVAHPKDMQTRIMEDAISAVCEDFLKELTGK